MSPPPAIPPDDPTDPRLRVPRRAASSPGPGVDPTATGDLVMREDDEPLLVELVSDGRLRAPREKTRQILRERLAKAEVMRTGRAWTVLRTLGPLARTSTREEAEENREVVMAGVLGPSAVALIDMIGFLASGLQTGILSVAHEETTRSICLHRGDVVWAGSNAPDEQIGEFLARRGKISRQQLVQAMAESGPSTVGHICVEKGLLAAHDLWAMIQALHTEIFDRLMALEAGVWTFSRLGEDEVSSSPVHMPTQHLLMDALRKLDEMRLYREVVRSAESVVRPNPAPEGTPAGAADPRLAKLRDDAKKGAEAILPHIGRASTILHLMQKTGRGEFDVTRFVYHLSKAGVVTVTAAERAAPRAAAPISNKKAADVIKIYSMAIREMFDETGRRGRAKELLEAATGFLSDPNPELPPLVRSVRLLPDGSVDAQALQLALAATPVAVKELCEALDELLFFLLFQATELVGSRRRDDLARRVKMIHAMLAGADGGPAGGGR